MLHVYKHGVIDNYTFCFLENFWSHIQSCGFLAWLWPLSAQHRCLQKRQVTVLNQTSRYTQHATTALQVHMSDCWLYKNTNAVCVRSVIRWQHQTLHKLTLTYLIHVSCLSSHYMCEFLSISSSWSSSCVSISSCNQCRTKSS